MASSGFAQEVRVRIFAEARDVAALAASDVARTAQRGLGALVIDLWRRRLKRGIGTDGKKLRKLAPITLRRKQAYVTGKLKGRTVPKKGPFAADGVPDFGAFSGRLKRDAKVKPIRSGTVTGKEGGRQFIETGVRVDVGTYGARILNYQVNQGVGKRRVKRRYDLGLADKGTAQRAAEDKEIVRFLRGAYKRAANARGVVMQEAV